jgi:hypothetical protein
MEAASVIYEQLPAHLQILTACGLVNLNDKRATILRDLLARESQWEVLVADAERHRLQPLFHRHIRSRFAALLPPRIAHEMDQKAIANVGLSLRLFAELQRVSQALLQSGISAIPFKGPTLALSAYGDVTLRPASDLDILIRKDDLRPAIAALQQLGYVSLLNLTATEEKVYLANASEYCLSYPAHGTQVELQWEIAPKHFSIQLEKELWTRTIVSFVGGTQLRALAAEDLLIVLCLHGAKHNWNRLGWICDIAQLLCCCPNLQWTQVWDSARSMRVRHQVALGLFLAAELLSTQMPEGARSYFPGERVLLDMAMDVVRQLQMPDKLKPTMANHIFFITSRECWNDRLKYAAGLIFTPGLNDAVFLPLPPVLTSLYSVIRPLRIAYTFAGDVRNRLSHLVTERFRHEL